jgi:hypothetical protein
MSWIPKADLLRDYPELPAKPVKGVSPIDAPAGSPYLNRPLRRFQDVAAGCQPARAPDRTDRLEEEH